MELKEAARKWVGEFNAIPQAFIERAMGEAGLVDGKVEVLSTEKVCGNCDHTEFFMSEDVMVCTDCGHPEEEAITTYGLPMWGTMWTFGERMDEDWVRDHGGLEVMRECGFWVYDDEDLGIFFGINGAGYDFYEAHWIPLYLKRGLQWHKQPLNEITESQKAQ